MLATLAAGAAAAQPGESSMPDAANRLVKQTLYHTDQSATSDGAGVAWFKLERSAPILRITAKQALPDDALEVQAAQKGALRPDQVERDGSGTVWTFLAVPPGNYIAGLKDRSVLQVMWSKEHPSAFTLEHTKLYPNPTTDYIMVELPRSYDTPVTASLYDLNGHLMLTRVLEKTETRLPITELPEGWYRLELHDGQAYAQKSLHIQKP